MVHEVYHAHASPAAPVQRFFAGLTAAQSLDVRLALLGLVPGKLEGWVALWTDGTVRAHCQAQVAGRAEPVHFIAVAKNGRVAAARSECPASQEAMISLAAKVVDLSAMAPAEALGAAGLEKVGSSLGR
jgi:hypothetical protein